MGYTHYFSRLELEHDLKCFRDFASAVRKVVANLPEHSCSSGGYSAEEPLELAGDNGIGAPEISDTRILFNGKDGEDDLGHENFLIERVYCFSSGIYGAFQRKSFKEKGEILGFCKTARKPYDLAVQAALILYKYYFGDKVIIRSDGNAEDWESAFKLVDNVFGFTNNLSLENRFIALRAEREMTVL